MSNTKSYLPAEAKPARKRAQLRVPGPAIFSTPAWEEIARSLNLSKRELQIVHAVFDDQTEFSIAAELGISPHTVHTHVERLHHKLAVKDRGQLILRVVDDYLSLTAVSERVLPSICANRTAGRCPFRLI